MVIVTTLYSTLPTNQSTVRSILCCGITKPFVPLQWRHNEPDCVSNHRRLDCLLNRLIRRRSKKTLKTRFQWPLWEESTRDRWQPSRRASNAENVSIWWRHYGNECMPSSCCRYRNNLLGQWVNSPGLAWTIIKLASFVLPAIISLTLHLPVWFRDLSLVILIKSFVRRKYIRNIISQRKIMWSIVVSTAHADFLAIM